MKPCRPLFHISPSKGWVNDPNGFCYFQGQYHLFAQYNPYDVKWGPMHWLHFVSKDLVHFEEVGVALKPDQPYDQEFGCFSGSAIEKDGVLYLIYTGVNGSKQTQCVATSTDGIHFTKYAGNPVIDESLLPPGYLVSDFRDPKVFQRGEDYYLLVSCRKENMQSSILLYRSKDLLHYSFVGVVVDFEDLESNGMAECPDILFFDSQVALIASVQFKTPEEDSYHNLHNVIYSLGQIDLETGKWIPSTPWRELDHGFDVYATQTIQDEKGQNYLVYWENMWDDDLYPDREEGFCGTFSTVRPIRIVGEHLRMGFLEPYQSKKEYLHFTAHVNGKEGKIVFGDDFSLTFHPEENLVTFTRFPGRGVITNKYGHDRMERSFKVAFHDHQVEIEALIDTSCAELCFEGGRVSFSSRIYGCSDFTFDSLRLENVEIDKK